MKLLKLLMLLMLDYPITSPRQVLAEDLIEFVVGDIEPFDEIVPRDTHNGTQVSNGLLNVLSLPHKDTILNLLLLHSPR